MNKTLPHFSSIDAAGQRRLTAGDLPRRAAIVLAAALLIPSILVAAGRADATYSGTLQATLTVAGFLDADRNPIAKPAGLTLENIITFFDDDFILIEGDATAVADAAIDVIAGDPSALVAGDRFDFNFSVSGTTVYPTGFSYAGAFGNIVILAENSSPDPVTISFDFEYDHALSTLVDNPDLESAYAIVSYEVSLESDVVFEQFIWIDSNDSHADAGTLSFEVTLSAGQSDVLFAAAGVTGDPFAEIPEPMSWMLGALGAASLVSAGRSRRSSVG